MRFHLNLSPRNRRRLTKFRSKVSWYAGYPIFWVGSFFRAVGTVLVAWWRQRNIRYLLQGLPAVLMTVPAAGSYSDASVVVAATPNRL